VDGSNGGGQYTLGSEGKRARKSTGGGVIEGRNERMSCGGGSLLRHGQHSSAHARGEAARWLDGSGDMRRQSANGGKQSTVASARQSREEGRPICGPGLNLKFEQKSNL
jgi:hypothetical protein